MLWLPRLLYTKDSSCGSLLGVNAIDSHLVDLDSIPLSLASGRISGQNHSVTGRVFMACEANVCVALPQCYLVNSWNVESEVQLLQCHAGEMCLSILLLPLHHKVQKFSSGTGSPGWSRKKGWLWWWWCRIRKICLFVMNFIICLWL